MTHSTDMSVMLFNYVVVFGHSLSCILLELLKRCVSLDSCASWHGQNSTVSSSYLLLNKDLLQSFPELIHRFFHTVHDTRRAGLNPFVK